jgi:hypothetical protein
MVGKKQGNANGETREIVFEFLVEYKRQHDGNTPSTREIAEACCLSTSAVNYHLTWLELEDRICVSRDGRRSVEIVGGTWELSTSEANLHENDDSDESDDRAGRER